MKEKDCENCKVQKWFYDMYGDIICYDNCPYKGETDEKSNNIRKD